MQFINEILLGDALERLRDLPDETVDMCLTSPPYFGLRDYGIAGQIGQEDSPEAYVEKLLLVFAEVNRVLKPEGTLWLNIADSYAGSCQGAGTKHPARKQHSNRGTQYMLEAGFKSKLLRTKGCKSKDMIGIGKFSAATNGNPLFECAFPIVLDGSINYGPSSNMPANPVEGQLYFVVE